MTDQLFADLATGRHQIEHAIGDTGGADAFGQDVGIDRRFRGGFGHDRATGGQCGGDLVAEQHQWGVPWRDRCDHADRFLHNVHAATVGACTRLHERMGGDQVAVIIEQAGRLLRGAAAEADGGADLAGQASASSGMRARRCSAMRLSTTPRSGGDNCGQGPVSNAASQQRLPHRYRQPRVRCNAAGALRCAARSHRHGDRRCWRATDHR